MIRLRRKKLGENEANGDEPVPSYKCEKCDKVFTRNDSLTAHQRALHGKRKAKCSICSKIYSSENALRRHHATHAKEKVFNCSKCKLSFNRVDSLTYHKRTAHHDGVEDGANLDIQSKCDYCVQHDCPRHHVISVLRRGKHKKCHQCTICFKVTDNHSLTWRHEHVDHDPGDAPKQKGFQCLRCCRVFAGHKTFRKHGGSDNCCSPNDSEPLHDVRHLEEGMQKYRDSFKQ